MDLGIPQKSLRVRLKEEKEEKVIHSFMSKLREGEQESKGDLWAVRRKRQHFGTYSKARFQQVCTARRGTHSKAVFGTIFYKTIQ